MKLLTVVGTRPELIRLSLVFRCLAQAQVDNHIVHTGQNYDPRLSEIFFSELGLPEVDTYLGIKENAVGAQIGSIISAVDQVLGEVQPDALLVLGDTNSGLSAIAAARRDIPVIHMEAGNRCFDWRVPEEKNRKLIDHISTWLLPYTMRSREYLLAEGIPADRILLSGNPIMEVIEHFSPNWKSSSILEELGLSEQEYLLATVHRQENVDAPGHLRTILEGLNLVVRDLDRQLILSVHPRTRLRLAELNFELDERIMCHEPFGFFDFVRLESSACCVITDSGTVQEECSILHIPTVTCRQSTERPETVECGSNILCGVTDPLQMLNCVSLMLASGSRWVSPYGGPDHSYVAKRVVKFIVGNLRRDPTHALSEELNGPFICR